VENGQQAGGKAPNVANVKGKMWMWKWKCDRGHGFHRLSMGPGVWLSRGAIAAFIKHLVCANICSPYDDTLAIIIRQAVGATIGQTSSKSRPTAAESTANISAYKCIEMHFWPSGKGAMMMGAWQCNCRCIIGSALGPKNIVLF